MTIAPIEVFLGKGGTDIRRNGQAADALAKPAIAALRVLTAVVPALDALAKAVDQLADAPEPPPGQDGLARA